MENQYIQKIIFGSPGTGKSHMIDAEIIPNDLGIDIKTNPENVVKAVFHPEYTYGDFMGKLLPMTKAGHVEYNFYEGHFLKALAQAYKNLLKSYDKEKKETLDPENVILVIDEINRGNSSAIFGSVFQLLDRDKNGWSSYQTTINGVMFIKLLELIGGKDIKDDGSEIRLEFSYVKKTGKIGLKELQEAISFLNFDLINQTIKIPPNLSIVATMNTSDSSIYHMDTAFKRRWDWEFIDIDSKPIKVDGVAFKKRDEWDLFIQKINLFIKSNHGAVRGIEDKQIGKFFIKDDLITNAVIQSKLMFFIWDSVFTRDKKPLLKLLVLEDQADKLVTFGDFAIKVKEFIQAIKDYKVNV